MGKFGVRPCWSSTPSMTNRSSSGSRAEAAKHAAANLEALRKTRIGRRIWSTRCGPMTDFRPVVLGNSASGLPPDPRGREYSSQNSRVARGRNWLKSGSEKRYQRPSRVALSGHYTRSPPAGTARRPEGLATTYATRAHMQPAVVRGPHHGSCRPRRSVPTVDLASAASIQARSNRV